MAGLPELGLDRLLALIGRTSPAAWYPLEFHRQTGIDRRELDQACDALRLAGLIELTPWQEGRGQGLRVTPMGAEILLSPRWLDRLSRGVLPQAERLAVRSIPGADFDERSTFGRGESVRRALLTPITPRVTQILIAINVIIFIVGEVISSNVEPEQHAIRPALVWTGAVNGDWLMRGQWWRLFTSCFVHHGIMHLGMNMYALWVLGPLMERLWGRWRFLVIYLLAGIVGSCAAMAIRPLGTLAGASGCIWGLLSAQLVWVLVNRSHLPQELVSDWARRLGSVILLNVLISFLPGISAEAHFAGGAAGAVVAGLLHLNRFFRGPIRWLSVAVIPLVPMVAFLALLWAMNHTPSWTKLAKWYEEDRRPAAPREKIVREP